MAYKLINKLLINLPKGFKVVLRANETKSVDATKVVLRSTEWVASLCGGVKIMECDLDEFCGESPNEAIELMVKEIAGRTIIWNGRLGTAIYEVPFIFPKIEMTAEMEDIIYAEGKRKFVPETGRAKGKECRVKIRVPCELALDDGSGICGAHHPRALLRPIWAQASFETPDQVIDSICEWLIEGHSIPDEAEVSYIPLED